MATLTGLFQRGTTYYLRIVLPLHHPLKGKYKNGTMVASMGRCSHREAVLKCTIRRAQVLGGADLGEPFAVPQASHQTTTGPLLRAVYGRWKASKTARDRLTWVKSVLKYAARDLGLIDRNPWEGIDISFKTTNKRRPWTDAELTTFFTQPLHTASAHGLQAPEGQEGRGRCSILDSPAGTLYRGTGGGTGTASGLRCRGIQVVSVVVDHR